MTQNLFHFTRQEVLPSIAAHGLDSGMVFVTPYHYVEGVWLTSSADPSGHGLEIDGNVAAKKRFRLRVLLDPADPQLRRYRYWARDMKLDRRFISWMSRSASAMSQAAGVGGGERSDTWYVYFGVIPVSAVVEVFDLSANTTIDLARATGAQLRGQRPTKLKRVELADVEAGRIDLRFSSYKHLLNILG